MEQKHKYSAWFRFYAELNDFLPPEQQQRSIQYFFNGHPGIKDPIETLGVPHSEVELILVNGRSVGFDYQLQPGDQAAVYPVFESLDISPLVRLREKPLRQTRFVVDVNLGKLARWLRLLGFDAAWRNDYSDQDVVATSVSEKRIILTRDRRLLYHRVITHGCWVRSVQPAEQVREVLQRLDLWNSIQPFRYCLECNGPIQPVTKEQVLEHLEPLTKKYYDEFYQCRDCGQVYWKGSHYQKLLDKLEQLQSHA